MDLSNVITITADDLSEQQVDFGDTIKFVGGSGIETAIDEEGNVTINNTFTSTSIFSNLGDADTANLTIDQIYEPAIAVLRVDNVGTSAYTFNSHYTGNNPNLYALAGTTIAFHLSAIPDLPFEIQDPTGNPFNTGLVHVDTDGTISTGAAAQGKSAGTLYWRIPESISGTYRYECQLFPAMFGVIVIKRLSVI
jgi:plastocyanin